MILLLIFSIFNPIKKFSIGIQYYESEFEYDFSTRSELGINFDIKENFNISNLLVYRRFNEKQEIENEFNAGYNLFREISAGIRIDYLDENLDPGFSVNFDNEHFSFNSSLLSFWNSDIALWRNRFIINLNNISFEEMVDFKNGELNRSDIKIELSMNFFKKLNTGIIAERRYYFPEQEKENELHFQLIWKKK